MAERIEAFTVECAANTPRASRREVRIEFNPGVVQRVELVIPDGHAGLTGIALAHAHGIVIPYNGREFIIGNGETIPWPLEGFPNAGAWTAFVYNEDIYLHRWYLRFLIVEIGSVASLFQPTPVADRAIAESVPSEGTTQPGTLGDEPPAVEPETGPPIGDEPVTPEAGEPAGQEPEPDLPPEASQDIADIPLDPIDDTPMPPDIAEPPPEASTSDLRAALHSCRAANTKLKSELRDYKGAYARLHGQVKRAKARHGVPMHGRARQGRRGSAHHREPATRPGGVPNAPKNLAGHPELHSGVAHMAAIIMEKFHDVAVSSTTGGNHVSGSYHYRGEAVDLIAPTQARMNEVGAWVSKELGPHLTEGIHNPTLSIKNGRHMPSSIWQAGIWEEHLNHIHIAVDQGQSSPATASAKFFNTARHEPARPAHIAHRVEPSNTHPAHHEPVRHPTQPHREAPRPAPPAHQQPAHHEPQHQPAPRPSGRRHH